MLRFTRPFKRGCFKLYEPPMVQAGNPLELRDRHNHSGDGDRVDGRLWAQEVKALKPRPGAHRTQGLSFRLGGESFAK